MKKIKLFLTTVLILTLVLSGMPTNIIQKEANVKAESESENIYHGTGGDYWYEILDDGTMKITRYETPLMPDTAPLDWTMVPSEIDGKDVTCIGEGVFQNCTTISNIIVPDSITTIESYAFAGTCATIELPTSIKSIGEKAFYNCTELTSIKISVNTIVGNDAFSGCDKLKIEYITEQNTERETTKEPETQAPTTQVPTTEAPTTQAVATEEPSTEGDTTKPIVTTYQETTITVKLSKPNKVTIKKINIKKKSAKKIKLTLKKITGVKGYQVAVYKTKNNAKKNNKAIFKKFVKNTKVTIKSKKLKNEKKLYVRARAYVMDGKTKLYGEWSKVKKVK